MLPTAQREYLDEAGRSPFARWRAGLNETVRAKVSIALRRLAYGNHSNVKSVGGGVSELRVDFGPRYRVYFGRDGVALVILLAGGTKKRQQQDIANAQDRWADYKRRKRQDQ